MQRRAQQLLKIRRSTIARRVLHRRFRRARIISEV
jgi:hypothetical protein